MTIEFSYLEEVALGELSADEAHKAIRPLLLKLDERNAQRIYSVLRSWVWKALNSRRRDDELRDWYDLLQNLASYVRNDYETQGERIRVLYELIYESISVSEVLPIDRVLSRAHVPELLQLLQKKHGEALERTAIAKELALQQANLSRVINLVLSTGLVERSTIGKSAYFALTAEGVRQENLLRKPSPAAKSKLETETPRSKSRATAAGGTYKQTGKRKYGNFYHSRSKAKAFITMEQRLIEPLKVRNLKLEHRGFGFKGVVGKPIPPELVSNIKLEEFDVTGVLKRKRDGTIVLVKTSKKSPRSRLSVGRP